MRISSISNNVASLRKLLQEYRIAEEASRRKHGINVDCSLGDYEPVGKDTEPFRIALQTYLHSLPPDALTDLCGVMLLGRGDFATLTEAVDHTNEYVGEDAASYMLGKTIALEKYLVKGLEKLR